MTTGPASKGGGDLRLPVVGHASGESGATGTDRFAPDPARLREGWEHRFVATGERAEEMMALYRELGFEVAADPVATEGLLDGCATCFGGGQMYRSIYTRRPDEETPGRPTVGEDHPTRVLREEHRRILQVADVLAALLDGGASDADFDRIGRCIRFIRLFADACHHGKEEDLLFPALEEQGLPHDSGPIAVMLHEHRLGRRFASLMAENVDDARGGDPDAWGRLEEAGRDYVGLIRGHILKEDDVLFDMADQLVSGSACTRLCAAYDGTNQDTFEGCSKTELEALGREIVEPGRGSR